MLVCDTRPKPTSCRPANTLTLHCKLHAPVHALSGAHGHHQLAGSLRACRAALHTRSSVLQLGAASHPLVQAVSPCPPVPIDGGYVQPPGYGALGCASDFYTRLRYLHRAVGASPRGHATRHRCRKLASTCDNDTDMLPCSRPPPAGLRDAGAVRARTPREALRLPARRPLTQSVPAPCQRDPTRTRRRPAAPRGGAIEQRGSARGDRAVCHARRAAHAGGRSCGHTEPAQRLCSGGGRPKLGQAPGASDAARAAPKDVARDRHRRVSGLRNTSAPAATTRRALCRAS